MVVAAIAVHVAVQEFFASGFPDLGYFNREMQGLAGQCVIAIDRDHVALDASDRNRPCR